MDTSVLIVGTGPTGLMLALELSLLQIPFRIIDANVAIKPTYQSRSLTIQSRSLELLARHDIAERILAAGLTMDKLSMFLKRKSLWEMCFPGTLMNDTLFPKPVFIRQPQTEEILEERLMQYGGKVERGMAAEKIETDADGEGVTVWVRHRIVSGADPEKFEDKEETIKCKYVVGCDGLRSKVRSSAGIKFEGSSSSEEHILADATVDWDFEYSSYFFVDKGYAVILPIGGGKDRFRVVCKRSPQPRPGLFSMFSKNPIKTPRREVLISEFNDNIVGLVPGNVRVHSPTWLSTFSVTCRLASTYNVGRLFIAGDAAHVHPPVGGQGMNCGMQDAVNLAWKLARVLRSTAPVSLLDSYEIERRKVANEIVSSSNLMFDIMKITNPFIRWLRNFIMSWVMPYLGQPNAEDQRIRHMSQLSIRYRKSPIVATASGWRGKLRGGSRAPDGWVLNSEGERVSLHGLCKKPADYLILFSGNIQSLESCIKNEEIQQLKSSCSDLVVLKVYNKDAIYEASKYSYSDPDGKIHGLYKFDRPGYVLIRPDGYISHIGHLTSKKQLMGWISTHLQYKNDIE